MAALQFELSVAKRVDDVTTYPFDAEALPAIARFLDAGLPPAHRNLGIRPDLWLKEAEVGRVLFRWPNDGSRDISSGRVFGGWIAALSDHVVSLAMSSALAPGEGFTTQDLQIKIFRPVAGDLIEIEAWVKNRSRTTGYVEADWRLPNGKIAAKAFAWKAIRPAESFERRD
jgi:acyl-coenzyme A thioesterase PaaI-like protein